MYINLFQFQLFNMASIQETKFHDLSSQFNKAFTGIQLSQPTYYDGSIQQNSVQLFPQCFSEQYKKQPPFKIYSFQKYDYSTVKISNQKHDRIIDNIIEVYTNGVCYNIDLRDNTKLIQLIRENRQIIDTYCEQLNPKAWFISVISPSQYYITKYRPEHLFERLQKLNKKEFPLLSLVMAKKYSFMYISHAIQYFRQSMKYGEPLAFLFYGSMLRRQGKFKQSYQFSQNAYHHGVKCADLALGKLFGIGGGEISKNPDLSIYYYQRARNNKVRFDIENESFYQNMKNFYKNKMLKALSIKTNQQTQANVVADFISTKKMESSINLQTYTYGFGMQKNNICHSESYGFIRQPKIYYVVFSPLMTFIARGFLAQDQAGTIEVIYLYGWQKMDPKKLALLNRLGTKVILKQHIRKYSSTTQLPMIRVQSASWIQIVKNNEEHRISNKKLRQFSKLLFAKDLFDKCIVLYKFLIERNAEELEIVYSNLGLCYQNKNQLLAAIQNYQMSTKVKYYEKSYSRMFYCYLNLGQFQLAQKVINNVKEKKTQLQLTQVLNKIKKKKQDEDNFTLNKFIKKSILMKYCQSTQSIFETMIESNVSNQSGRKNIDEFKRHLLQNKDHYMEIFNTTSDRAWKDPLVLMTQTQFMIAMREVFEVPEILNLSERNIETIHQFYHFIILSNLLPTVPFELLDALMKKQHFLMKRLIKYCRNLENHQKYKEVLDIYTYGFCLPHFLYLRACQIYRFIGQYQKSLQFSFKIAKQYGNQQQELEIMNEKSQFKNQYLKSLYKLKRFKQLVEYSNSIKIRIRSKSTDPVIQKAYQLRLQSQLYFALAFYHEKNYEKSDEFVCQIIEQQNIVGNDLYFQAVWIKVKILESQLKLKQAETLIQVTLNKLEKKIFNGYLNKDIFVKVFKKQKLILTFKGKSVDQIVTECEKILKISKINYIFVSNQIKSFVNRNILLCIDLMQRVKKSKILCAIWEDVYEDLRSGFIQALQFDNKQLDNAIATYFKISKQSKEKAEQQQQNQQNQIEDQQLLEQFQTDRMERYQKNIEGSNQISLCTDQQNTSNQYKEKDGYICDFEFCNQKYIVFFDPKMRLPKQEEEKFICASNRICQRKKGENGIKVLKDGTLRLKIRQPVRLRGKKQKLGNRIICIFYQRQGHDDYKRC